MLPRFDIFRVETDGHLVVRDTGGGSARKIQVGRMTDGNWVADSDLIPYLAVGGTVRVTTRFTPLTPHAIQARKNGGYMLLAVLVMGSLNGTPVPVTVRHEDAASQWEYETDFEIICRASDYMVSFFQKARRTKPLSSRMRACVQ